MPPTRRQAARWRGARGRSLAVLVAALIAASVPACAEGVRVAAVSPPMLVETTAHEAAGTFPLPENVPQELAGLHNVYPLSENVISGGEPHDEQALAAIAEMGVKTILSVDGKVPDAATAAEYGLRYVHIPIQYRGMTRDELLRITKTFRELEGPFYVHCFHGQHRGPAAAAVGRLVLDGAPRHQAIAEMRQWCGTSPKYEGLYQVVGMGDIPTVEETEAYDWDFPAAHEFTGFRQLMIRMSRAFEAIAGMAENDWNVNPDHPDVDPVNESAILMGLFEQAETMEQVLDKPTDFQDWVVLSREQSAALRNALADARSDTTDTPDFTAADAAFATLDNSCSACHAAYRND